MYMHVHHAYKCTCACTLCIQFVQCMHIVYMYIYMVQIQLKADYVGKVSQRLTLVCVHQEVLVHCASMELPHDHVEI